MFKNQQKKTLMDHLMKIIRQPIEEFIDTITIKCEMRDSVIQNDQLMKFNQKNNN